MPFGLSGGAQKYRVVYDGDNENKVVGQLSEASDIRKKVIVKYGANQWPKMQGVFVNDVFVWTYEDTVRSDEKNHTPFAGMWCAAAKERGFIYVVDFAGYAKEV